MPRPRLRHPNQPLAIQLVLAGIEFLASLRLAVIVIVSLIVVLATATFIETSFGAPAARFAVYRSWWFTLLGTLLGINVFCAAAVRFPWKRYQTGFVITHAGILVLLTGSLLTARHGIDAQLSVYEGTMNHLAFEDNFHFEIERLAPSNEQGERVGKIIRIPFRAGPFNWRDFSSSWKHLFWAPPGKLPVLPWNLAHRDHGVVYRDGDITLEVLDYYADSRRVKGGYLGGYISVPTANTWIRPWQPFELNIQLGRFPGGESAPVGSRTTLPDGTRVIFSAALDEFETEGFLLGFPEGDVSELGQVVLVHNKTRYVVPIPETENSNQRFPLGDSGLDIVALTRDPRLQSVQIRLRNSQGQEDDLILFADLPEFNRPARKLRVAGAYWVDFSRVFRNPKLALQLRPETTDGADHPRIEICQGPGEKLYYRAWRAPQFLGTGVVPLNSRVVSVDTGRGYPARIVVNTFLPFDFSRPDEEVVVPMPFRKGARMTEPRVKIRLTAGASSQEMWLAVLPRGAATPLNPDEVCRLNHRSEQIELTAKYDAVDVGFWIKLLEFQRRLDPGTNQPSHYASLVDLYVPERVLRAAGREIVGPVEIDPETGETLRLVHSKVLITLNHPINVIDPLSGRSYRLYQESFSGPFRPGDPIYERVVGGRNAPDELYVSTLSVNYDPGRGFKYMGSLLIVGGIVVMYLMRAYMFRPRKKVVESMPSVKQTSETRSEQSDQVALLLREN